MKKKCLCGILFSVILSGCILPGGVNKDTVLGEERLVYESPLPEQQAVQKEKQGEELAEEPVEESEAKWNDLLEQSMSDILPNKEQLSDEDKAELMRSQQQFYAFSTLEVTQQNLYVEILYALINYVDEMTVSTNDTGEIDKVYQCVLMDHPEIFYTDGYSFVKYTLGDTLKKITFKGTYIYTEEEKKIREEQIEKAAMEILKGLPAGATDYEKVKYVYETVIHQTEYSVEASDNQNICSVFLGKASVCQGYAKAVQYLLYKLGVPATLVIGTVENGEGHAWNLVRIDNAYYYVDATWGDASYLSRVQETGADMAKQPAINYDYLCVTTEDLLRTHAVSDLVPMPQCHSLEANYYVREGAYFNVVEKEQLKQLFQQYQEAERETVTIKCANQTVYQEMTDYLLQQQQIFEYLKPENNSILYTDSPKQLSLTFWL